MLHAKTCAIVVMVQVFLRPPRSHKNSLLQARCRPRSLWGKIAAGSGLAGFHGAPQGSRLNLKAVAQQPLRRLAGRLFSWKNGSITSVNVAKKN
ncbi:hypothetical protein [Janthinobacterium lividum]|uniref:Uncharacterized protein n=1 Tax=Janthinobacterium lividum TaxID=29581 RepID=A0ABU0Y001_9BURK|nr:hypothetical protein [Janthinobacterium lividum]MDQ4627996.1 hypothetical protein [Janthinobacterium lividum]MDQ4676814.1 hypothetical protein [Janthinobacterium lividum]MDQ4686714.1 hypothetical protein [Janthinobacterium lividum]